MHKTKEDCLKFHVLILHLMKMEDYKNDDRVKHLRNHKVPLGI